jgi:hypothetical protein
MNEADMERLLRDHPGEFFAEPLALVSQQEGFRSGVTDLIFQDAQGDLLVVELKRGTPLREHIAQVIDYLGDVEDRYPGKQVELMVVANIVPPQRRTKLERLGVSFREIPEIQFRNVAMKYGVQLSEQYQMPGHHRGMSACVVTTDRVPVSKELSGDEQATVATLIAELLSYGERWVANFGRGLKQDLESSGYAWLSRKERARLSRWCNPNRWSSREQWVQPRSHAISKLLFGSVIGRESERQDAEGGDQLARR